MAGRANLGFHASMGHYTSPEQAGADGEGPARPRDPGANGFSGRGHEYNRMRAMLKGVLLLAGLVLLAFGAEGLFYAATNREQITTTCEAVAQSPPRALWLRVTGCEMDYVGAGYREVDGRIVELYFPARPAGRWQNEPAPLVATTSDPSVLALAEGIIGGGRTPDQEQFLVMMLKIVTALRASREIEGYASASLLDRLRARRALSGLSAQFSPNVIVIDLHTKPSYVIPGIAAAAGLVLLGMFAVLRSKRRVAAPAPVVVTPVEVAPPTASEAALVAPVVRVAEEVAPARREPIFESATRLRVMLLNLRQDAGREAIETAPPLGARADVIARIAQIVPGLRFDVFGRASIGRADFLLSVDIGPTDPVYTVVLDAQGAAALPIVRRILDRTSWRAFEAKSGVFIPADRVDDYAATPVGHTAA